MPDGGAKCACFLRCNFLADFPLIVAAFEVVSSHSEVLSKPPCHSTAADVGDHCVIL